MPIEPLAASTHASRAIHQDTKQTVESDSALSLGCLLNVPSPLPSDATTPQQHTLQFANLNLISCESRQSLLDTLSAEDLASLVNEANRLRSDCLDAVLSKDTPTLHAQWFDAARNGRTDVLKLFIDAGLPLNTADEDDRNAQHYAAESGNVEATALLWDPAWDDKGVSTTDGKPGGSRLLCHFADRGNERAVRTLLTAGANPNSMSLRSKRTALQYAVERDSKSCVQALVDAGACPNGTREPGKESPLSVAIRDNRGSLLKILLTQRGINLNIPDNVGFTALGKAVELDCYRGPGNDILAQLRAYEASRRSAEPQQ